MGSVPSMARARRLPGAGGATAQVRGIGRLGDIGAREIADGAGVFLDIIGDGAIVGQDGGGGRRLAARQDGGVKHVAGEGALTLHRQIRRAGGNAQLGPIAQVAVKEGGEIGGGDLGEIGSAVDGHRYGIQGQSAGPQAGAGPIGLGGRLTPGDGGRGGGRDGLPGDGEIDLVGGGQFGDVGRGAGHDVEIDLVVAGLVDGQEVIDQGHGLPTDADAHQDGRCHRRGVLRDGRHGQGQTITCRQQGDEQAGRQGHDRQTP